MNTYGTIVLSLMSLFERLSYYGVRVILVLYAFDVNGLNISSEQFSQYSSTFTIVLVILPLPFGLLTDKILGQRRAIFLGGFLSLIGYCLLITQNLQIVIISLGLILIGTSLVKPSTVILVGRQFAKEDKNRALAYIIFFTGINLGAFLGIAGIGYIGEMYNWTFGFLIAGASTILYLLIYYFLGPKINNIETNNISGSNLKLKLKNTLLILPLLILIDIVFWKIQSLEISDLFVQITDSNDNTIFGIEVLNSMIQGIESLWTVPFTIGIYIYWKLNGVTNTFKAIVISFSILILAILCSVFIESVQSDLILEYSMIPLALYAFAEVLISPIIVSYLTRTSDVNYSNTIYASFCFLVYSIGSGIMYLILNEHQTVQFLITLTLTIILLIGFKDQIRKLTFGIN